MHPTPSLCAILPCNDLDASEAFYGRLGFARSPEDRKDDPQAEYRILRDARGASLHLNRAVEGWLLPGKNPFGLYLYVEDVDAVAETFRGETIEKHGPEDKPWGMYELSLDDPDQTLVRVGWPSRLRNASR